MDLNQCREQIDRIDRQLLSLFAERMEVVSQVADYKIKHDLPILNLKREQEVIMDKMRQASPEIQEYVKSFFINLMETSKCYQLSLFPGSEMPPFEEGKVTSSPKTKIACPGTRGAYSHIASRRLFPDSQITFYPAFKDVFEAVQNGQADYGVVPIENSTAGSVGDVYDYLNGYCLAINLTYQLKVEHCLACAKKISLSEVEKVYSHKQALEQCSCFLSKHHLSAEACLNTALAAEFVSRNDSPFGAICSEECAEIFGLEILRKGIQNASDNYTKFIVVSRKMIVNDDCGEVGICVRIPNRAGELNKMLTKFSLYSINMSKIESRPIAGKDFDVRFYINFAGSLKDKNVAELICDLQYNYESFKVLGNYENRTSDCEQKALS